MDYYGKFVEVREEVVSVNKVRALELLFTLGKVEETPYGVKVEGKGRKLLCIKEVRCEEGSRC